MEDRTRIEALESQVAALSVELEQLTGWLKVFTTQAPLSSGLPMVWTFVDAHGRLIEGPDVMNNVTAGHRALALAKITRGEVHYGYGYPTTFNFVAQPKPSL